jgi:hypothetical protein
MISTIESKQQQLINGFYQTGTGSEQILLLGSCRTLPYLSYLKRWNDTNGDRFTIRRIDACDWTVENVDIDSLETDERILKVIREADFFIHEHLESYGFVNTSKDAEKNIYQFGMNAGMKTALDITIPNFHDHFILENDYGSCGLPTPEDYIQRGEQEVSKFCAVCELSSFPEMASYFRFFWPKIRFFWRPNHISAAFSMYIFRRMNSRFLNLKLTDEFLETINHEDLFKTPCTEVTQRDIDGYHLEWT